MGRAKLTHFDYALFSIVYFVQGALALASIALPLFMRSVLGLSVLEITYVISIAGIPWILKPFYGMLSDYYPLYSLRRKPYLLIASALASIAWIGTALSLNPLMLIIAQFCSALGIAATDVFVDGLAVQKSTNKTRGRVQSVCWGARGAGALVSGALGGYLASVISYQLVFYCTAALPMLTFVVANFVKETPVKIKHKHVVINFVHLVKTFAKNKQILLVSLFLFVWFVSPSFGTPFFFHMKEYLHFSTLTIGVLLSIASLGGLFGAFIYAKLFDQHHIKKVLRWFIWFNFFMTFSYLYITDPKTGAVVYFFTGMLGYMTLIVAMKLAAASCPKNIEASSFAIVTSVVNFSSGVLAPLIGGQLFRIFGLTWLIVISAFLGLLALFIVPYLDHD